VPKPFEAAGKPPGGRLETTGRARTFTFHDLRHSFGTLAVQVYPVTDVQVYMGHQKIETTMRYVHFVPKVDAAAKGSAFIGAQMDTVSLLCPEPVTSDHTQRNSEQPSAA
jgi:hypothetical protein